MTREIFKPIFSEKKKHINQIIEKISPVLAKRFWYLDRRESEIAMIVLRRHFMACFRLRIRPDLEAIEEIINDAENLHAVHKEKDLLTKTIINKVRQGYQKRYQAVWKRRAQNRLKLRKYHDNYRQRNLESVRLRQREAYRTKHSLTAADYRAKLDERKVLQIRAMFANGISIGTLARVYGVSDRTIYDAAIGRTWKKLPIPLYDNRKCPNRGRHIAR